MGCLTGALQPAAAQRQQSFLTHCVLGMEGCPGSWLLFATNPNQSEDLRFFDMSPPLAVLPTRDFQKTVADSPLQPSLPVSASVEGLIAAWQKTCIKTLL